MRLLHELVPRAAARSASPAVRGPDGAWTYGELDGWSNSVARELQSLGVNQGDRVALWTEKACRVVAAMQGVLRLGAAYVPLAALTPPARAQAILSDCGIRCVVTDTIRLASLGDDRRTLAALLVDDWRAVGERSQQPFAPPAIAEDDLAYVLYTSGSTGQPKGVCVSHHSAMAFVEWAAGAGGVHAGSRLANHAAFNFDLSVFDLYAAFHAGACVTIVPETLSVTSTPLTDFIARERITVWYSVPSALVLMMDHGGLLNRRDLALQTVIFAGEVFPVRHLRRLRDAWPGVRLLNFYGPTETNVCASYEVGAIDPARTAPVPIGRASCGNRIWLGDSDGRPIRDAEGQLFVEGPTVMSGYWGRELHGRRPYATGDICRIDADGNFVYVGRLDHQVKIRGHRVELGEIETVLAVCPGLLDVAVVVLGEGVDAKLVACYVPERRPGPTLVALKEHCATRLPPYMIVNLACPVDVMPRTANGKIDRHRLLELAAGMTLRTPSGAVSCG
ncbi:MAG: amino acid adenylation domain-containing protein [Vicinamibacterales bacterium]